MKYMVHQIEARGLPLVISWVGSSSNLKAYDEAAFAAGYDVTLSCKLQR
jgi:hypothetical protein